MKAFYCDHFVLPLPGGHRLPMEKYSLLRERVLAAGIVAPEDLIVPHAATDEEILRAHDPEYLRRVAGGELAQCRRAGLPVAVMMAGGYNVDVRETVEVYLQTVAEARRYS